MLAGFLLCLAPYRVGERLLLFKLKWTNGFAISSIASPKLTIEFVLKEQVLWKFFVASK
jgi:hypothetical protein